MTASWVNVTGGGAPGGTKQPLVEWGMQFPDAFASGSITFYGIVLPVAAAGGLGAALTITGSAIALPAVPGAGNSLNWILELNTATGAATTKTGTAATTGTQVTPAPDTGNIVLMTHTVTNGDVTPWLRSPQFPDLN